MVNADTTRGHDKIVELRHMAHMMDSYFRVPGTKFRFGADAILGLLPGAGDFVAWLFSIFIIIRAKEIGTPKGTLGKMVFNSTLDFLIGSIPIFGNVFDFFFKANNRNLKLMGVR